jgi:hypothetical protein
VNPTERRKAAYIDAAPPITVAERDRLARVWRASGSELVFEEPRRQVA